MEILFHLIAILIMAVIYCKMYSMVLCLLAIPWQFFFFFYEKDAESQPIHTFLCYVHYFQDHRQHARDLVLRCSNRLWGSWRCTSKVLLTRISSRMLCGRWGAQERCLRNWCESGIPLNIVYTFSDRVTQHQCSVERCSHRAVADGESLEFMSWNKVL